MSLERSDEEILGQIVNWYKESAQWRRPLDAKVQRQYEQFRNYLVLDDTWAWQSQIYIPEAFTAIWTALPALLESMLNQPPFIRVQPLRKDVLEGSKYAEKLLDLQLSRIGKDHQGIYMLALKFCQEALLYGNSFIDLYWRFDEGIKRRRKPIFNDESLVIEVQGQILTIPPGTIFQGYEVEEKKSRIYDDPDAHVLDWMAVYPDPYGTTVQSPSRYIITRETWTEEQAAEFEDNEAYKKIKSIEFTDFPTNHDLQYDSRKDVDEIQEGIANSGKGKFAEIIKCQYARKHKNEWREWWTIIANKKTIIFDDVNPYHHDQRTIIKVDCFPLNGRFYSIGLLEPTEDLSDGINQRYNQIADVITMLLNPMFKVSSSLERTLYKQFQGNLPATPGLLIPVEPNENIEPLVQYSNIPAAAEDLAFLQDKLKNVSGTPDTVRGSLPARKETATAIIKAEDRASLRFRIIMKIIWYTGFRPMADIMNQLNHQFKTEPENLKVRNEQGIEEFRQIFMEDIPYDGMAFLPNMTFINPGLSQEIKAANFERLIGNIAQTPGMEMLDWREILKITFDLHDILEEDRLLLSEEEVQEKQVKVLMQALQAQGGQQAVPVPRGA